MHGDNVVESTVEVQVDTPVVFYQTKETSLHVSCYGSMHGSVSMQECNNNPSHCKNKRVVLTREHVSFDCPRN